MKTMNAMNDAYVMDVEPTSDDLKDMETQNSADDFADVIITDEFVGDSANEFDGDSMKLYLNDIGKFSLLTAEEEQQLARTISEGGKDAKDAREKLITANLRLVMHYAKKYVGRGVELSDLNTMGTEGLIKAVEKFDYKLGYRFSTYASWWIKQSISRGISDEGSAVRIPVHMSETINKIAKVTKEYYQNYGDDPSTEEICEMTGFDKKKVENALASMYSMVSMDTKIGEDGDSTLEDFIADTHTIDPGEEVINAGLKDDMQKALKILNEKEAKVLCLRYGIGAGATMTLEEIAKLPEFGVTRERIRQIEAKAMRKLQHNPTARRLLVDYYPQNHLYCKL